MLTSVFVFLLIMILILLVLLLAILLFECEILLFYKYGENVNNLNFMLKIGKVVLKKDEIEFNKPVAKKRKIKRSKWILKYLREINTELVTSELNIRIIEGTGNAAYTAIIYGVLYFVAEIIKVFFEKNTNLYKDNIEIMCDFNKKYFSVDISCIFRLKLVNIISEGFRIYRMKNNNDKAGDING